MKNIMPALRSYLFFTVLLGLLYPLVMTGLAQIFFAEKAGGSLIYNKEGQVVGSSLIAQKFENPKYFWPRPSSQDYNPLPSGGTNLGMTSQDLKKSVDERRAKWAEAASSSAEVPLDLLFASGSGLDPHISPAAAQYQAARVAQVRGLETQQVQDLVNTMTRGRQFGILGEPTVNVLVLNKALDEMAEVKN
ncbi:Potassium-transporting ATPase C chain [compost metagenome]